MSKEFSIADKALAEQKEKELGFAALTRREKYILTGVSPSTQRRYEFDALLNGKLTLGDDGKLHLNLEAW